MPISPENMALYPGGSIRSAEWKAIREAVRERAGDRCEECGVENHARGIRLHDGTFLDLGPHYRPGDIVWIEEWIEIAFAGLIIQPEGFKVVEIVCTTAHLDRGLTDHSMDNLRFWCQRCHNRHDAPSRAINAKATRSRKLSIHPEGNSRGQPHPEEDARSEHSDPRR